MASTTISQRLKLLIDALDLKLGPFSRTLGVSETNVRNYIERGSKPSSDFLEKLINHFEHVNSTWLLTGRGEMLLNETKSLQSKHAGKHKSQAINTDNGSALMNFNTVDDCRRELTAANNTIELLRSQLHDKERIIQLLEMQLQK